RQVMWEAIRRLQEFTLADLEVATLLNEGTVRSYVDALALGGYLDRRDQKPSRAGCFAPTLWRLIKDVGVEAPRLDKKGRPVTQGLGREQMWRT
ncbi:hypothetical protein, partial [Staphylococcus aureus]|uniref:hypothetical protein n=1 Tax=Staphylococcus aureus TaxID=1280 RepID=UPI003C6F92EE